MIKIKIIQVGKTKDNYLIEGLREFLKRLQQFAEIEILTVKEVSRSKTITEEQVRIKESEAILSCIEDNEYVVALDEKGREMDSLEFGEFLGKRWDLGERLCFVIGGAFGLNDAVRNRAKMTLAFSKMTFTHQMIRLILLEQLWRGFCIIKGKEYHH